MIDKSRQYISNLIADPFLRNNAIFLTASLLVSFINYLYYPILGRLMNPAGFGEVQTVISLLTQASLIMHVLGFVSIGIMLKYEGEKRDNVLSELSRLAIFSSVGLFALTLIASPLLQNFFHFSSIVPFVVLGLGIVIGVPLAFAGAYLQGKKRFGMLSISNLLNSIFKIVTAVVLVALGFQVFGAVMGLVFGQLIALAFALSQGQGIRHFIATNFHLRPIKFGLIRPEMPYVLLVFASALTINLLLSLDILMVKHYFEPSIAGLYTGISIISNIIFFLTGPIAMVMIPSLRTSNSPKENLYTLKRSLFLTLTIGGSALLVFCFFPTQIVSLLFGAKYAPYASYLPLLSIAIFMLSISNLLIYFHVVLRHYLVAVISFLGLAFTLILLNNSHATLGNVVNGLLLGSACLLVVLAIYTVALTFMKPKIVKYVGAR